jgi:prevent-host-death family protein
MRRGHLRRFYGTDGGATASTGAENYDHHDLQVEDKAVSTNIWSVAEAKAKFSELIELARSDGAQTVTRRGRTAAVVVAAEEWERKTKRTGNLAEFFAASPLRGSKLEIGRVKGGLQVARRRPASGRA